MFKPTIAMALAILLAGCEDKPTEPPKPKVIADQPMVAAAPVLSPEAYGPVSFGASLKEAEEKLGEKAQQLGEADPACSSVKFKSLPKVRFMVEQGIITRADAEAGVPNIFGLDVGGTLAQAKEKMPAVVVGPHKYLELGHYLTIAGERNTALIMEEDGKQITKIRGGLQPSVAYVEVCL